MDESLSFESLLEGAKKAGHKAMDDHGRGEFDEFALHGGVAIERLTKAVLVKRNPIYLVEMRNGPSDMLLYFGGDLAIESDKVRTVGANEAIKRLRRIGVLPSDPRLDLLIELRNGTAHTTVGDQARPLLATLAETIGALLRDIRTPTEHFWGRWISTVNFAIDKQRDDIERDVQVRIRQARHLLDDRLKGLPDDIKGQAFQKSEQGVRAITLMNSENILALISTARCPACGNDATVQLRPTGNESDLVRAPLRAHMLACPLCALELTGWKEIRAAGMDKESFLLPSSVALYWGSEDLADEGIEDLLD